MRLLSRLSSYYLPIAPQRLVYMLQLVEYDGRAFLKWCVSLPNLRTVMQRGSLNRTRKAKLLLVLTYLLYICGCIVAIAASTLWLPAILLLLLVPDITIIALILIVVIGNLVLRITRRGLIGQAQQQLTESRSVKIAVLGSYGKTTMKELLLTVLGNARVTRATPGNMNVPISHARWITTRLTGDEDFVILEYGEGEPGDTQRFIDLSSPDYAVLTGVAPNHLDRYPDYDALKEDLSTIAAYLEPGKLLVNEQATTELGLSGGLSYGERSIGDWDIRDIEIGYDGVLFTMHSKVKKLSLHSPLLGRHQIGPLAAVAYIGVQLGLTEKEVSDGIALTKVFEHRMQPRLLHGAWIIDDTYNGNLEGIRAGLELLKDLPAKRKIYVTPGLVDQGVETKRVHTEIGEMIAQAKPDKVVLMDNSVTAYIQAGIQKVGFSGEVEVQTNPKEYYLNLEHIVAAGDLYVLQNDWPDQYS